jgi:hypothetical protein
MQPGVLWMRVQDVCCPCCVCHMHHTTAWCKWGRHCTLLLRGFVAEREGPCSECLRQACLWVTAGSSNRHIREWCYVSMVLLGVYVATNMPCRPLVGWKESESTSTLFCTRRVLCWVMQLGDEAELMWNVVGAVGILSVAITHVGPSIPTRAPTPGLWLSHKLPCDHPARHLYHLPRLPASRQSSIVPVHKDGFPLAG